MKELIKPLKLRPGDKVATVSPCHGWAGDPDIHWKYKLGVKRLSELDLDVVAAPNSLKGSEYLARNPQARAEDIMWAFENKEVHAIIANVGGNDSIKIVPYIDSSCMYRNPKIFIGYSDVMNLHFLCYKSGLSSFYGDNLLNPIAEQFGWHEYSKKWFIKTLFDTSVIGTIEPFQDWTFQAPDYVNRNKKRDYYKNDGYELIQGKGKAYGHLIGGHTGIPELTETILALSADDFEDTILFVEDIPEFFTSEHVETFFNILGNNGILQKLKGIVIGKTNENRSFDDRACVIRNTLSGKHSCNIPVIYGLNFGHSSPMCVLPYGAAAEIDCDKLTFSILESGVV